MVHGGEERGTRRCYWWMPQVLVCRWLASAVARRTRHAEHGGGPAVFWLQHAWTGWDGDGRDARRDLDWALDQVDRLRAHRDVVLVGHSMGARTSVRSAARRGIVGVVGLAPWLPAGDPVDQLTGKPLDLLFGTRDRQLPAPTTAEFVEEAIGAGALVSRTVVSGGGHALLWRWWTWHRLTAELCNRQFRTAAER